MPSDERVRLHVHQRIAPREHSAQRPYHPPGGVVGPSWPDPALLEKRQLLAEEAVLRRQGDPGSSEEEHKPREVDQHFVNGPDAVSESQTAEG